MQTRRDLFKNAAGTAATVAISGIAGAPRILGANDRVRFGLIGCGGRGKEIFKAAIDAPNSEVVAVADLYTRRLDEAKAIAPKIQTYRDFRRLLDDKSIDAVLIATPQHQHVLCFVPAIQAGKDVYQEKTMAFSPEHARRMRKALDGSGRVVQVGMQMNSGPGIAKVKEYLTEDRMGTITAVEAHHYRNHDYGGWLRPIPADCDQDHIDWNMFQGETAPHAFDPMRYLNWRFFWDYSGGNVFENMVHQVAFWFEALKLSIPETVNMTGANLMSPKMQVPDVMNVTMNHPEKVMFTWHSNFHNNYYGEGYDYVFGTKGTVVHDEADKVEYMPQGDKRRKQETANMEKKGALEYLDSTDAHMRNFFDCVRSRKQPNVPFEMGFKTAIACQMSIASYRQQRQVRWDPVTEQII